MIDKLFYNTKESKMSPEFPLSSLISMREMPHLGFFMTSNCAFCKSSFTSKLLCIENCFMHIQYNNVILDVPFESIQHTTLLFVNICMISESVK